MTSGRLCGRTLGLALGPLALVALPAMAVALWEGAWAVAASFGVPIAGGVLGVAWGRRGPRAPMRATGPTLAAAWAVASALCSPVFWAGGFSPLNALFESVSALTSTGLTVAGDPRELALGVQAWRSVLQWLGGVGILYMALALACVSEATDGDEDDGLAAAEELGSGEADREGQALRTLLLRTWAVYGGLTALAFAALMLAGMGMWDAANHAMTAVATGGFSTSSQSLASFGVAAQAVTAVAMTLGAVSFVTLRLMSFGRRPRALWVDPQARWLLALWLPLFGCLLLAGVPAWPAAFEAMSALATAGFTSRESGADLVPLVLLPLTLAMLVGASAGSTAGGFKLARFRRLVFGGARDIPGGHRLSESVAATRWLAALYAGAFLAGTVALALGSKSGWTASAFEAASALGTVGLSSGLTSADASAPARWTLILLMWIGRLEVVAVLSLIVFPARRASGPGGG